MNNSISKKWYQSRLVHTGVMTVLAAVLDGVVNGLDWRQIVVGSLGALIVVLRADTTKGIEKG